MESLNIQLGKSKATARHRRRAVWRWCLIVCALVMIFAIARIKATANVFQFVPRDTQIIITLLPSQNQWRYVLENLGNEPLINGLTISELSPNIEKSVALFVTRKGERFVGIHGNFSNEDIAKLEAHGFYMQRIDGHIVVIGNEKVEMEPVKYGTSLTERLIPNFAGSIIDMDDPSSKATIHITKTSAKISISNVNTKPIDTNFDGSTIFFGVFVDVSASVPKYVESLFSMLSGGSSLSQVVFSEEKSSGSLTVAKDGKYLVEFDSSMHPATIQKILQMQNSLQNLQTTKLKLPDGSSVNELRVSKDLVEIASTTNNTWKLFQPIQEEPKLFAGINEEENETFFTNSADLLIKKTTTEQNKTENHTCGEPDLLFVSIVDMANLLQAGSTYFSTPIPLSNTSFVQLSLDKSIFGASFRLCNAQTVENSSENLSNSVDK